MPVGAVERDGSILSPVVIAAGTRFLATLFEAHEPVTCADTDDADKGDTEAAGPAEDEAAATTEMPTMDPSLVLATLVRTHRIPQMLIHMSDLEHVRGVLEV